jgi:heme A synthase
MRYLGLAGLLAVILQGTLGGLTVLYLLPTAISVSHAGLAQIFLCVTVSIAVFTSRWWKDAAPAIADAGTPGIRNWTKLVTAAIYVQTLLGALMRHTGSGLAIPDWPLSYGGIFPPRFDGKVLINFVHRTWGLAVAAAVIALVIVVLQRHKENALRVPAVVLLCAVCMQVMLGGLTVWSARAEVVTTFHVAGGAFTLACSLFLTLAAHRAMVPRPVPGGMPLASRGIATE